MPIERSEQSEQIEWDLLRTSLLELACFVSLAGFPRISMPIKLNSHAEVTVGFEYTPSRRLINKPMSQKEGY